MHTISSTRNAYKSSAAQQAGREGRLPESGNCLSTGHSRRINHIKLAHTNFKLSALGRSSLQLSVSLPLPPSLSLPVRLSIKRIDDALNQGPFGCNNGHLAVNLINFVLARYVFELLPSTSSCHPLSPPRLPRAECSKCSARLAICAPVCGQLQPQPALQFKGIRVENMQEKNSPHMVCNTHPSPRSPLSRPLTPLFHSQL